MKTEIELLEEKINTLRNKQALCKHEWSKPEYDPEKKEITTEEIVYLGSDSYYKEVGTGNFENINRWSRICKKCGKKEYTYKEEKVVVKTLKRPAF